MAGEVGNAYVSVVPKVDGNPEAVGSELGEGLSKGAKSTFGAGAVALGNMLSNALTSVASAVGEQIGKTFWNYADYEQLVGGVDTLFKGASQAVQENAKNAFKSAGMSANEYMENVTSFSASLISSLDGDTAKAAEIADRAIVDMSDNANKMGTDIERITDAYQGFAKQNYTMLDNLKLGYGGTKGEMERLLADAGKIANTEFNIDSYADVIEAIHVIQEQMDITGTTMEEGSRTISGSLNQLNGAWENFLTAIGDGGQTMDLSPVIDGLLESLGAVALNVVPAIARIGETIALELPSKLAESFTSLEPAMVETIGGVFGASGEKAAFFFFDALNLGMGRVEGIFSDLSEIVNQAIQPLGQLVAPVFSGIASIISDAMNTALGAISGVTGFISANVMPLISDLSNIITPVIEEISGDISDAMSDIFGDTDTAFGGIETLVNDIWPAIADTIKTAVSGVASVVRTVWPVIKNVASTVFNAVKSVVMAVWPVVSNVIKTAVNTAKNVVSTAVGAIKGAFKTFSNIAGTVKNAFNAVKDAITKPIETAKATLKGILDKIKSFFPLNIGKIFSNLQLPRISVNGGTPPFGIGGKGSLPSFNIQWYARGGILDDAALIGAGERGTEFIWPGYDPYMSKYAKAIASNMPNSSGGITVNFTYNGEGDATDAVNLLTSNLRQLRATGAF